MITESQKEPLALHKIHRVFCSFFTIAFRKKKLNIPIFISSAKRQWHDVVEMVVRAQRPATTRTFSFLQLIQFCCQIIRQIAAICRLSGSAVIMVYAVSIRILLMPSLDKFPRFILVSEIPSRRGGVIPFFIGRVSGFIGRVLFFASKKSGRLFPFWVGFAPCRASGLRFFFIDRIMRNKGGAALARILGIPFPARCVERLSVSNSIVGVPNLFTYRTIDCFKTAATFFTNFHLIPPIRQLNGVSNPWYWPWKGLQPLS